MTSIVDFYHGSDDLVKQEEEDLYCGLLAEELNLDQNDPDLLRTIICPLAGLGEDDNW